MTNRKKRTKRPELPLFLTTDEVADALAVDPSTVRRWIEDGKLPAVKPGGCYRIRREAVDEMLTATATTRTVHRPLVVNG